MGIDVAHEFANHLRSKDHLAGEVSLRDGTAAGNERTLQKLWELTELSANDFADEVAQFFEVPRVPLPDLLAAEPLVKQFSRRFLREMTVFPYRAADGKTVLAVADPSDTAAVRAAGIVLGDGINVAVASFEDITTVLNRAPRRGGRRGGDRGRCRAPGRPTTISRACATWRAARRWCAR